MGLSPLFGVPCSSCLLGIPSNEEAQVFRLGLFTVSRILRSDSRNSQLSPISAVSI